MNKIKILSTLAGVCVIPSIFMIATSCKEDDKLSINIADEEKVLSGDDMTVVLTGPDGLKLSNIKLVYDDLTTVFATVDGEVMINGETKLEFKLCDKVTTDVENLAMSYSITGGNTEPIRGFRFKNLIPKFTVPTIEMSTTRKGVTGVNVTWLVSSSYFLLSNIALWKDGQKIAKGLNWTDYKTSGGASIEFNFFEEVTEKITDTIATFSYANADASIIGEAQVTDIEVKAPTK